MNKLVALFLIGFLAVSCKKAEDRRCFKSWGNQTTREIPLGNFNALDLREHMEFVLIQDSLNKVVVRAGEHMVKFIEATVQDGVLTVENKNKCRFLRSKKKQIIVEIHFTYLNNLKFGGTEPLNCKGTLQLDYFTMMIRDGAGPVHLNVNAIAVNSDISHGFGDYTLTGTTQDARLAARSNGFFDASGLVVTDSLFVVSETVAPVKVNASNIPIHGYLKESGNIYYVGNPTGIDIVITGTGQVKPI